MKAVMPVKRPDGFRYNIPMEDAYVADLQGYQSTRKDSPFMNDSPGHAMLLADMMVGSADDYVLIYTGCLFKKVYEFAITTLSNGVKVRILHDDPADTIDAWWNSLAGKDIIAHHLPEPPVFKGETVNHFFVCDGVAVRYEISDEKTTATANFNMPGVCRGLSRIFAESWKRACGNDLGIAAFAKKEGC